MESESQPTPGNAGFLAELQKLSDVRKIGLGILLEAGNVLDQGVMDLTSPDFLDELFSLFQDLPLKDGDSLQVRLKQVPAKEHREYIFSVRHPYLERPAEYLFTSFVRLHHLAPNCIYWSAEIGNVYVTIDGLHAILDLAVLIARRVPGIAPAIVEVRREPEGNIEEVVREIEYP